MNAVEEKFLHLAQKRGNLLLFSRENAIDFVELCQDEGIMILGVDGFFLTDDTIEPSLENSIDLSELGKNEDGHCRAIKFLASSSSELHYEIVCE